MRVCCLAHPSYSRPTKETPFEDVLVGTIRVTTRSIEYECLLKCLQFMDPEKRELILDYHVYEGHDKIVQHEIMARELGISKGTLRLRTHHNRSKLEECILKCRASSKEKQKLL